MLQPNPIIRNEYLQNVHMCVFRQKLGLVNAAERLEIQNKIAIRKLLNSPLLVD